MSTFATTAATLALSTGGGLALAPGTRRVLETLEGWYSPAGVRRESAARLWGHGSFSERGWRDERLISVGGHVIAESRTAAALLTDELAAVLADGTEGTFSVTDADVGTRSARVFLTGTPTVAWAGGHDVDFAIDLVAPDPRKYGPLVQAATLAAAPGGGLAFPLFGGASSPGVLDFGARGVPGTVTVRNTGTAETSPAFTVEGRAPGFTITEIESGARLVYAEVVDAGHSLVLDAADGSVVLDGVADRGGYLTRREWSRIPGGASRTYLFESPGNTGARMTIGAAPAWW